MLNYLLLCIGSGVAWAAVYVMVPGIDLGGNYGIERIFLSATLSSLIIGLLNYWPMLKVSSIGNLVLVPLNLYVGLCLFYVLNNIILFPDEQAPHMNFSYICTLSLLLTIAPPFSFFLNGITALNGWIAHKVLLKTLKKNDGDS